MCSFAHMCVSYHPPTCNEVIFYVILWLVKLAFEVRSVILRIRSSNTLAGKQKRQKEDSET